VRECSVAPKLLRFEARKCLPKKAAHRSGLPVLRRSAHDRACAQVAGYATLGHEFKVGKGRSEVRSRSAVPRAA